MQLKNALLNSKNSNRGVSPVIGVILMVVITVILAGVISVAVLDFGGDVNEGAPQASFDDDYDSQTLTLTHQNGDEIDASNLKLFVDGSEAKTFSGDISAGSQLTYDHGISWNGESVRLVYDDGQGNTATLYSNDGTPQYLVSTTYDTTTQFDDVLYSGASSNYDTTGDVITLTSTSTAAANYAANGDNGLSPNPASSVDVTVSSVDSEVAITAYDSSNNIVDSKTVSSTGTHTLSGSSNIDMVRFEVPSSSGTAKIGSFTISE